jgi:hypothetical protein
MTNFAQCGAGDARCAALQPATSDVCADWLCVAAVGNDPDQDGQVARW